MKNKRKKVTEFFITYCWLHLTIVIALIGSVIDLAGKIFSIMLIIVWTYYMYKVSKSLEEDDE